MFNSDVDRLRRVREECQAQYMEEEEDMEDRLTPDNP